MDEFCNTPRLVGGQCVHGIDENGLYAALVGMLAAVIEHGIQKTFRFTGAGSRSNKCGNRIGAGEPLKRLFLVQVWRVVEP